LDKDRERLEEALELAKGRDVVLPLLELARLPGGDVEAAAAARKEHGDNLHYSDRMNVHFRLWELTQDASDLEEAKRILQHALDHAPEEARESMVRNVRLQRAVYEASSGPAGS